MNYSTKLIHYQQQYIILLPQEISNSLPSRGISMGCGYLDDHYFETILEPNGLGGHWFFVTSDLVKALQKKDQDFVQLSLTYLDQWTEPSVPPDLLQAIKLSSIQSQWSLLTTKARWEWIRWIRFTNNENTRNKRIETACSMLLSGKKRPCCFDHSKCTEPTFFKNGILKILLE